MTKLTAEEELIKFTSHENFQLAWKRVNTSLNIDIKDRLGIEIFSVNVNELSQPSHVSILCNEISESITNYIPHTPYFIHDPKSSETLRIKTFLSMQDRIVYQSIGNIIIQNCYEEIEKRADKSIFAHIPSGISSAHTFLPLFPRKRFYETSQYTKFNKSIQLYIQEGLKSKDFWMLETDITSFYPSIDHNLLMEMLKRRGWLKSPDLLTLLTCCLEIWSIASPETHLGQGVPVGYETSEILATLYLLDIELNQNIPSPQVNMLRFVDDMYFFMQGEKNIHKFYVEYELALQKRGLIINTKKTRFELCTHSLLEEYKKDWGERKRLSFISENPHELVLTWGHMYLIRSTCKKIARLKSRNELKKYVIEHSGLLAFILWRYKKKNEQLKAIALYILEKLPHRVLHAAEYLSQDFFKDDPKVYEALESVVLGSHKYAINRKHCMNAMIKLKKGLTLQSRDVLLGWVKNRDEDWLLRDFAVEELMKDTHPSQETLDTLRELSKDSSNYLIQSKVIKCLFNFSQDLNERIELINYALQEKNETLKSLGIMLYRQNIVSINREALNLSELGKLKELTLSSESIQVRNLLLEFINFSANPDNKFIDQLSENPEFTQYLFQLKDISDPPVPQ